MNDRLSSPFTVLHKFGEPALVVMVTVVFLFNGLMAQQHSIGEKITVIVALLGMGFAVRLSWNLKSVEIDGNQLCVSNYFREEMIPLGQVLSIDETYSFGPQRIKLLLREPSGFGDTIVFIPSFAGFYFPLTTHPVVKQLRELIENNGNAPVA